jgi:hypothetical protein
MLLNNYPDPIPLELDPPPLMIIAPFYLSATIFFLSEEALLSSTGLEGWEFKEKTLLFGLFTNLLDLVVLVLLFNGSFGSADLHAV